MMLKLSKNGQACKDWNDNHPEGTRVAFRSVNNGPELGETTTTSPAWLLGGHTPCVMIAARSGAWALSHLRVLQEGETLPAAPVVLDGQEPLAQQAAR